MERSLPRPSLVKLIFFLILTLSMAQSCVMGMRSLKLEARKLVPRQETMLMMRKMLPVDYIDGCGCYSDDDCRNTHGCGSYCSPAAVIGICGKHGPAQE